MLEALKTFWQSKTFGFLAVAFLVGSAALFLGKIVAGDWLELIKWLGGFATVRGTTPHLPQFNQSAEVKKNEIAKTLAAAPDAALADELVSRTDK